MGRFRSLLRKALNYIDPIVGRDQTVTTVFGGRPSVNIAASEYNARASSIVAACLNWISRNIVEAPIQLQERKDAGQYEPIEDHEVLSLLANPNPHYDCDALLKALALDLNVSGNAYIWMVRNGLGAPLQLWWLPSTTVEPMWDKSKRFMGPVAGADDDNWITHYTYRPDGMYTQGVRIDTEDIIHFRTDLDPSNPRLGCSPLKALAREYFTDEEAASWTASFLKNGAIPTTLVYPDTDESIDQEQLKDTKKFFEERFGGSNRGSVAALSSRTKVSTLSWSPEQMNLKGLRRIPEERISAALGVPAIVAGLGAGLDRSTFANFQEARRHAYESNIIPMQKLIGGELRRTLVPEFISAAIDDPMKFMITFDLKDVRVMREDAEKRAARIRSLFESGIMTRAEARRANDLPADDSDDFYLLDFNKNPVHQGEDPHAAPVDNGNPA